MPATALVQDSVDSPSGSGLKSVVSGPLDHVADFDPFWEELIELLKTPVKQFALKSSRCSVSSDSEFTVARLLDGSILRTLGKGTPDGKDSQDFIKYTIDKAKGSIRAETYGKAGLIRDRDWGVLHRGPPMRLEWWGESPGARKSSSAKSRHLQSILEAVFARARPEGVDSSRIRVAPDAPSVSNPGLKSAVSPVLDGLIDFEDLWSGYIFECKAGAEVGEISAREFSAAREKDGGRVVVRYRLDRENREIYSETYGPKGSLFERRWTVFHREPLRLECWGESPGERKSGKAKAMFLQALVDGVIARVTEHALAGGGSGSRVKVHPNVASPSGSGQLSAISEPLDAVATFSRLWDGWLDYHKRLPKVARIKRTEVAVVSDSEFRVVATLDEQVLLAENPLRSLPEDGHQIIHYSLNKARGTLLAETCGREGRVRERNFAVLHKNPLRLEWWGETPGDRKFGAARGAMVSSLLEAALLPREPGSGQERARVAVETGVASPTSSVLRSALSEPLDKLTTFEQLWADLVRLWKCPPPEAGVTVVGSTTISDREFEVSRTTEAGESTLRYALKPWAGEARIETLGKAGRVRDRNWAVLHRSPLQLEMWGETTGERKHGPAKCAMVQELVTEIVRRANPGGARIRVSHGVASPTVAGLKSVISEPMDHVISYDRLWRELVELLKDPIKSESGIKESGVRIGMGPPDEEFAVAQVLHPPPLRTTTEYKISKSHGWVYSEAFAPDGNLQERSWAVFHARPLRVECWDETHVVRKFGPARRNPLQSLVDAIMRRASSSEAPGSVKVNTNVKLKCVASGDMGKRMDFERLWKELVDISMSPHKSARLTKTSETEFTVVLTQPAAKGKGKDKGKGGGKGHGAVEAATVTLKYRLNKKRGEVYREVYGHTGKLDEKIWIMVRRGPLRLESWAETPGVRRYGRDKAMQVQGVLNAIIAQPA